MRKFWIYLVPVILLNSCSYFEPELQPDAVAQIGDAFLSRTEIQSILPEDYTASDSALIVQKYIDEWATDQMLMRNARQNISEEQQGNLNVLIDRYKTELYSQAYLQELINHNLDTIVTAASILEYYKKRKEEFVLNEDLVKFKYLVLDKNYVKSEKIKELFKNGSAKNDKILDSLSLGFRSYSLNDNIWVKKNILLDRVSPITAANEKSYIIPGQSWELEDSLGVYLVRFKDVLRRGEQAPLSYVNPTIKQILRNQRKLAYIKKIEKDILNDAIESNRLKINP